MSSPSDIVSSTPTQTESPPKASRRRTPLFHASGWLIPLLFLLFALFVYFQFTSVSGLEIHPQTWQLRRFSFRREPLTNYQLTGVVHAAPDPISPWIPARRLASLDPAISTYLRTSPDPSNNWHLVELHSSSNRGEAAILFDLLTATETGAQPFWPAWSKAHSQHAAIFWPAVQDLAEFGLYSELPPLFELAIAELSADTFKRKMTASVQEAIWKLARSLLKAKESERALSLAKHGLAYGDHQRLQDIVEQVTKDNKSQP